MVQVTNKDRMNLIIARWGNKIENARHNTMWINNEHATKGSQNALRDIEKHLTSEEMFLLYCMGMSKLSIMHDNPNSGSYNAEVSFKIKVIHAILSAYLGVEISTLSGYDTVQALNNFYKDINNQVTLEKKNTNNNVINLW